MLPTSSAALLPTPAHARPRVPSQASLTDAAARRLACLGCPHRRTPTHARPRTPSRKPHQLMRIIHERVPRHYLESACFPPRARHACVATRALASFVRRNYRSFCAAGTPSSRSSRGARCRAGRRCRSTCSGAAPCAPSSRRSAATTSRRTTSALPRGQSGRLGGARSGHHGLVRLHLNAWGCPPHS